MFKFLILFTLIPLHYSVSAQSKHNICVASLNSKNEENVFRDYIDKKQSSGKETGVQITNLVKNHDPEHPEYKDDPNKGPSDWFQDACNSGVQCDVLLVSGHFAESFFGPRTGLTLGLNEMEKHSCQKTCEGLLKHPKEVFLMGCNTLADKSKSDNGRTFDSYVRDLTTDVLDNSSDETIPLDVAERIAMARYGPLGASLKDRMRSVFGSNSQLYGFDDKGPSGATVEQYLRSYLDEVGDKGGLEKHLDREDFIDLNSSFEQVTGALKRMNNPILAAHLDPGNNGFSDFAQCAAINQFDPEYEMKKNICKLHNKDTSLSQRLQAGMDLLQGDDYQKYLPSVTSFIKENYRALSSNAWSVSKINELSKNQKLKTRLEKILKELRFKNYDALPANQLDILITQKLLGHIDPQTLEKESKKALGYIEDKTDPDYGKKPIKNQFKNLSENNYHLLCTLKRAGALTMTANYDMFTPGQLSTPDGVRAMGCFKTSDTAITNEAMDAISKIGSEKDLTYTLMGLSHLPTTKSQKEILNNFASTQINHGNASVSTPAHRLILRTGSPQEVQNSMGTLLKGKINAHYVTEFIAENPNIRHSERLSALSLQLLLNEQAKSPKPSQYTTVLAKTFANITPATSEQWSKFSNSKGTNIGVKQFIFQEAAKLKINNPIVSDLAIQLTQYDVKVAKHNMEIDAFNAKMKQQGSSERKQKINYYKTGHTSYLRNLKNLTKAQYNQLEASYNDLSSIRTNNGKDHWRMQYYRSILNNQNVRTKNIPGVNRKIECRTVLTYQTLCM